MNGREGYLLDTHTLLFYLLDAPELSSRARQHIEVLHDRAIFSVVSLFEIAIKVNIGKLSLPFDLPDLVENALPHAHIELLPLHTDHLRRFVQLPYRKDHRDPFDRMLVAQALSEGLTLVSRDRKLHNYPVNVVWD